MSRRFNYKCIYSWYLTSVMVHIYSMLSMFDIYFQGGKDLHKTKSMAESHYNQLKCINLLNIWSNDS